LLQPGLVDRQIHYLIRLVGKVFRDVPEADVDDVFMKSWD